jgi:hypothetical protein
VVAGDAMVRSWGVGATMFPVAVGGGGAKERQVSGVFAIWSMWFWIIGFLVALRSIWPTWFSLLSFAPLHITHIASHDIKHTNHT